MRRTPLTIALAALILLPTAPAARAFAALREADTSTRAAPFDDSVFEEGSPPATAGVEQLGPGLAKHAEFIEAIEVIGNRKTERDVILRRIVVGVGDLLDEAKFEESRLRLLNTGYFKSVEFSLRRGSERGRLLLVIEVSERSTILVEQLYYGYSPVASFFGGLGVVETNFLGKGVSASAAVVGGRGRRGADLRLFVPDLSNTPLQLSASAVVVHGAELVDDTHASGPELTYDRIGGTLGVGWGVGAAQRVSLDYRLENVESSRLPDLDPILIRRAPSIQLGSSVLSSLALTYERDTRDDPFVPTQGGRLALGLEVATRLLGSTYEFSKYTAELQQAFLVAGAHSLIVRVYGGMVQGQPPFFDQFFLNDYAYFVLGRDALPRGLRLNFAQSNDYDDLVVSVGADYSVPVADGGDAIYRAYVYGGADVSATASLDELQEDAAGRGAGGQLPLSFDLGLKLDTAIGNFTVSLSYLLDLVL